MIRGYHYYSEKCRACGKLITGESEENRKKARKDFWHRLTKQRQEEHNELLRALSKNKKELS